MLKNPSHLFALDALMAAYPDALVVQCHRPVETIMASMCSLAQHTTEGWSNSFSGELIGQDAMETWSRGLELFTAERAKHDSAQFYDMDYFELDQGSDRHRRGDLPALRHRDDRRRPGPPCEASDEESKQGPRAPKHTYSLEDYGLTADAVKERFKGL